MTATVPGGAEAPPAVVGTATVEITAMPETRMYLSEQLATAETPEGVKVDVLRSFGSGLAMFIYSKDGRPGVEVDLRPILSALIDVHLGKGAA